MDVIYYVMIIKLLGAQLSSFRWQNFRYA